MKRISIVYAGREFSVGLADIERLKSEIQASHDAGRTRWITVNHGEGRPQPAELLVGPGIPIALMPIEGPSDESVEESAAETPADTGASAADSAET
jgi:hypothetical protein